MNSRFDEPIPIGHFLNRVTACSCPHPKTVQLSVVAMIRFPGLFKNVNNASGSEHYSIFVGDSAMENPFMARTTDQLWGLEGSLQNQSTLFRDRRELNSDLKIVTKLRLQSFATTTAMPLTRIFIIRKRKELEGDPPLLFGEMCTPQVSTFKKLIFSLRDPSKQKHFIH